MKHIITASAILLLLFSFYSNMSAQKSTSAYPAYSGLFNERGFTESNGGTFNGSEMVSNFNGNLIYKRN